MGERIIFRGRFSRSLDPKGRLMLPQEFRDSLAMQPETAAGDSLESNASPFPGTFALTTYDNCLVAFPWSDWIALEEKFMRIPNPSAKVRSFRRLVIGGAEKQRADSHGRILLSPDHRAYAGIDREAVVLGLVDRFEIWNPSALHASMNSDNFDGVSEELAGSGIDFSL